MEVSDEEFKKIKEDHINGLQSDFEYSVSKFDTQTLAISSGALAVSLTFINEIVPFNLSIYNFIFYIALALFIYCITIGFIGHFLGMQITGKTIDNAHNDNFDSIPQMKIVKWLNLSIVIALPLGILLLVLFCIINIETAKNKLDNKTPNENIEILIEKSGSQNKTINKSIEVHGDSTLTKTEIICVQKK